MRLRRTRTGGGFTLAEMLIVFALMAVLIALLLPTYSGLSKRADATVCFQHQAQMQAAWDQFVADPRTSVMTKFQQWQTARSGGVSAVESFLVSQILTPYLRTASVDQLGTVVGITGTTVQVRSPAMVKYGPDAILNISWLSPSSHPSVLLAGVNQ